MNNKIQILLARYRELISNADKPNPDWVNHYNDLRLVDACLDKVALSQNHPDHPMQIGIVGPTQAGKSTLVNLITDSNAAGVSARAGYTVHAQGFGMGLSDAELTPINTILEPMVRVSADQLDREDFDAYVLDPIQAGTSALVDKAVVWDSPDFDSIEARGYRGAVLYTLALSDVLILMVSKDKYGDKSVWDMLSLMMPLKKPILVVINKLNANDAPAVQRSFAERFQTRFPGVDHLPLIVLPYVEEDLNFSVHELDDLKQGLVTAEQSIARLDLKAAIDEFTNTHWARWIEPAENERNAVDTWNASVTDAIDEAFTQYESRYLNDEARNDTFNRALAELLNLLEIPGIAATLQKTREVVTWPVRKLFGFGMSQVRGAAPAAPPEDMERDVLQSIQSHVLTTLQGVAIDAQQDFPEQSDWWQALHAELRDARDNLVLDCDAAAKQYQQDFEPRIDAAAERLYQQLQTQPTLLNSLRAARVTTDAAAVALAVKSGGLAATDLLVAPAMLSVTTLLTESALGRYMATVRNELKAEQRTEVRQQVLDGVLGAGLLNLPKSMDQSSLLGLDLSELDES